MNLKIDKYPHAQYDRQSNRGFLCHYYVWGCMDPELWRATTYSPEILNFKEGSDSAISFFVPPFVNLLEYAIGHFNQDSAILVPVPSSIPKNDPAFSSIPWDKTSVNKRKNRDDRCDVFCQKVVIESSLSLRSCNLILRKISKVEKSNRSLADQINTLEIDASKIQEVRNLEHNLFVLVDDVETTGNTFNVCAQKLKTEFNNAIIIYLSIAKTNNYSEYKPLIAIP